MSDSVEWPGHRFREQFNRVFGTSIENDNPRIVLAKMADVLAQYDDYDNNQQGLPHDTAS